MRKSEKKRERKRKEKAKRGVKGIKNGREWKAVKGRKQGADLQTVVDPINHRISYLFDMDNDPILLYITY
jgi:hypothetical protein